MQNYYSYGIWMSSTVNYLMQLLWQEFLNELNSLMVIEEDLLKEKKKEIEKWI